MSHDKDCNPMTKDNGTHKQVTMFDWAAREEAATGTLSDKTQYKLLLGVDQDWQDIIIEGGGSSKGASQLCGTSTSSDPVDISGMTRPFNSGEATTTDGWFYECERSTREVIQVRRDVCRLCTFTSVQQ